MRPPIDGARALVTGASSGIGREFAQQLAPRVRSLVLVARRVERLEDLKRELQEKRPQLEVRLDPVDLSDRAATEAFLERLGPVDLVVNCAGLGDVGLFDGSEWKKIEQMLRVNVEALTLVCHRVLPGMIERRSGGILNVSSGFGLHFMPGVSVYAASKHYVTGLTESLRAELAGTGVVISQLCPGPVKTEFEEVAVSIPGFEIPAIFEISAETCVRSGLRGYAKGRALVVPGLLMKVAVPLGLVFPRPLRRWFLGLIARRYRRRLRPAPGASTL
ncbi:MAG TPA: SDR family oxidoreductase [Planctomycetota bacterium]|nr:SDR family oxidoreductase [Planctomycetota bacterium]